MWIKVGWQFGSPRQQRPATDPPQYRGGTMPCRDGADSQRSAEHSSQAVGRENHSNRLGGASQRFGNYPTTHLYIGTPSLPGQSQLGFNGTAECPSPIFRLSHP